jgi:hypothetical protein
VAVTIKVTVFCYMTHYSLVDHYQLLAEPAASLFRVEGGGSRFLSDIDNSLPGYTVSHLRQQLSA